MEKHTFVYDSFLPFDQDTVFSYHLRQGAIDRMMPPWLPLKIIHAGKPNEVGSTVSLRMGTKFFHLDFVAKHIGFDQRNEFTDTLIKGPFRHFTHTHSFKELNGGCQLIDKISYIPPLFVPCTLVDKELFRQFTFRHKRLNMDLSVCNKYEKKPLKILVSGSSGLVGSALCSFFKVCGHDVYVLKQQRSDTNKKIIGWDPSKDGAKPEEFDGFDVVVHLAGENIGKKRWSEKQKETIFVSRCRNTWLLSSILSRTSKPPKVFISASAVGIYGDCKDAPLDEKSPVANDFLARVCRDWESSTEVLRKCGTRVIHARFGYILHPQNGMLKQMLPSFKLCLGAVLGSGKQMFPWVSLDDVVYGIYHCINTANLSDAVNIVSPNPVSQKEFAKILAKSLKRCCFMRLPKFVLKLIFQERAEALLLRSANVKPLRLLQSGYKFCYENLEQYFTDNV